MAPAKRVDWPTFNRSVVKGVGHALGTVIVYALVAWAIISYIRGRSADPGDTLKQAVQLRVSQGAGLAVTAANATPERPESFVA